MATTEKSVLVEYSAASMYALVDDVGRYPEFLPWCGGAEVFGQEGDKLRATILIDFRGIRQRFSTENLRKPGELIEMRLLDGPFRLLDGSWRFKALGQEACKIEFRLRYEFSNSVLERLVGPVFRSIADSLVDAFVQRARELYGPR